MEGVVGQGFEGDLAIDDLVFVLGACPPSRKFMGCIHSQFLRIVARVWGEEDNLKTFLGRMCC